MRREFRSGPLGTGCALALLLAGGTAMAQPVGPDVRLGNAQFQQLGKSLLVTTTDGAGTRRSVIDWRSFSVPAGSITHFLQPGPDSTSINRVLGNKPSDILGTLSSNGQLVLVNPSGIAIGPGATVDTAAFTASALALSDADALAGRMRFSAERGHRGVDVQGQVLARSGDVVLLGTDVNVGKDAIVQAPNGAVLLGAGQTVALTGRGIEGIVLQVTSPADRAVNLGRLEGDAVGMFASQLRHTGVIAANHVVLAGDKVRLEQGGPAGRADGSPGRGPEPDLSGTIESPPPRGAGGRGSSAASAAARADASRSTAVLAALEAGKAGVVAANGELVTSLQAPTEPGDSAAERRDRRRAAEVVEQCTR
ncbi:filamentous hemagglutinin N-terminal domain-containing protein [Ramlibacter ginsenosidimutans]|uniref:Filamentous hemagglutinin N-terminal domain-containing protein n=1 Tax=Ramlibacter ginsenosidimutans TaxID=502333 RepID=A0A934TWF4_9BURK|nr:filamentous hemagglutinin N-terminal domain-containing protein [Ramlibacter ginsenosidimutans]MBK6008311.1 filamentous hemagglutinin N-terminal domain-containing protein [Ramlibacter ginsenosidimutans]